LNLHQAATSQKTDLKAEGSNPFVLTFSPRFIQPSLLLPFPRFLFRVTGQPSASDPNSHDEPSPRLATDLLPTCSALRVREVTDQNNQCEEVIDLFCLSFQVAKEFQRSNQNVVRRIGIPAVTLVANSDHSTVVSLQYTIRVNQIRTVHVAVVHPTVNCRPSRSIIRNVYNPVLQIKGFLPTNTPRLNGE
jgi:hypothetical protein